MIEDKIIIALDFQSQSDLDRVLSSLKGKAKFVKVGMELFYSFGPQIVHKLKEMGFKVFLDLKIHDIPNTAKSTVKSITKLGVDMINVHAMGSKEMMIAAKEGVLEALKDDPSLERPLLIAVTILTSMDEKTLQNELQVQKKLKDCVIEYAKLTEEAGLDGVVCSPQESSLIKKHIGAHFQCITPGIRPLNVNSNDQKRVTTPKEAFQNGSDFIVIGRAITKAESPQEAFLNILKDLKEV